MGHEFIIKLSDQDLKNLSCSIDGITELDNLLNSTPYFIGKEDSTYQYSKKPNDKNYWPSVAHINDNQICFCYYQNDEEGIKNYLMDEILSRCGHLEIKDV